MCPPHSQIVSYNSRHFEQIKYICKDVYGGHDYLPDQVENYSRASDKAVLVLEGGAGTVLGIVCIERRLDTVFVLGLRVHPQHHGRGIGARLTAAAEAHSRTVPGVLTMQTATIKQNLAMQSILGKQGWQVQQALDMWPSSEETVRLAQAAGGGTTVSHVDGAAAALSSPAALQLLPRWQVCSSVAELEAAANELQAELEPSNSLPSARGARCWLPFHYAPLPVESPEVARALKAGKVWILPSGSAAAGTPNGNSASQPAQNGHAPSGDGASDSCSTSNGGAEGAQNPTGTGCGGLLIVQDNFDASASKYSHEIAGIIGGSAAAVESALLLAARAQPFFVAFVARKPQHAPTLFAATPTQEQYVLVFKKDL